jgi:hypothetical protein
VIYFDQNALKRSAATTLFGLVTGLTAAMAVNWEDLDENQTTSRADVDGH